MKDGRTHLAHKAEHAVDLETGAIVSVTDREPIEGTRRPMVKTLTEAAEKVEQALPEGRGIEEVVADKGYHSTQRMVDLDAVGLRSYVSEPRRRKRRWRGDRQGQEAVYANRRRNPGRARAAAAAATRRAAGATLCASVRERRDETAACTGT